MHIQDKEIDKYFTYFLCAYYFHWTKEEVDNTESYTIDCMLLMLPQWIKKLKEMENPNL